MTSYLRNPHVLAYVPKKTNVRSMRRSMMKHILGKVVYDSAGHSYFVVGATYLKNGSAKTVRAQTLSVMNRSGEILTIPSAQIVGIADDDANGLARMAMQAIRRVRMMRAIAGKNGVNLA